ncbi:MAG: preprotein translocase subunit YajC [Candidatus Fimivivens sp.]
MGSYLMMGAMLVVVYLVMFLPQKKQQKKDAQMRASLDVGNEVLTQGGIIGRVVSLKDDTIVIETGSDRIKIRILRSAIVANTTPKE